MSGIGDGIKWFVDNFGKPPEVERPPLIPAEVRIPVFIGMVVVSLVLLALLLWLVIVPAMRSQQHGSSAGNTTGCDVEVGFQQGTNAQRGAGLRCDASFQRSTGFEKGPAHA